MHIPLRIIGLAIMFIAPQIAIGAKPATSCAESVYVRLGQEERLYRSVLFGLSKTENMLINSVLIDEEGDTWIKTADNKWVSPENQGLTWSDDTMEEQRDIPARRGILETQKALSSELLPSILQTVRATQCRMEAVCEAARVSGKEKADALDVKVQPPGCIESTIPVFDSCRISDLNSFNQGGCTTQVQMILAREEKMLELLLAYDASYRSLMQLAGTFEGFLSDFRFPLLQPLWQMVRTLGQLDNLPCFLAQCNE